MTWTYHTYQPGEFSSEPHPCATCGRPTQFWRCDACLYGPEPRLPVDEQPTQQLPAQPHLQGQRAQSAQPLLERLMERYRDPQRMLTELSWLADIGEIGGPLDGDEFRRTVEAVEALPDATPPAQPTWSGLCLVCLREQRERGVEAATPELARIQTCRRHLTAAHALARVLRGEALYDLFTEAFGFGHDGEQRQKGGAA